MKQVLMTVALVSLFLPTVATAQTIASSSSSTPYPGIRIVEGTTTNPTTDFYAAFVSLCNDSVHVDASAYAGQRTASSWGSAVGAELAVNGDFYTGSPRNHVYGDAVAGGTPWSLERTGLHADYASDWYHEAYGWIAFGDDFVEFTNTRHVKRQFNQYQSMEGWKPQTIAPDVPPGTKALVSGFPQLVIDGARVTCSSPTDSSCFSDRSDMRQRHPRTAMGLTEDRQTFLLVVVDGRSARSVGMYGSELAKLMHDLGSHVAFNLDGGGSAQMWLRGSGTINRPSDGTPRPVMNHWGIFAGTGNGLPSIPGHCDNRWDGMVHELPGQLPRSTDIDGDGRGDTCARTANGLECSLFKDGAFTPVFAGPAFSDASGWGDPSNYSTIRYGDIDGDGRADICARGNARLACWKSTGTGFSEAIGGPPLSDDNGFFRAKNYSTIRLADINGDGKDDVCARWSDGMRCYPSTGDGFGSEIPGPPLSDESGWDDPAYYGTIRVGDIDGDGDDDICARAAAGLLCWRSSGTSFGDRIDGPAWSNANGWNQYRYYSTIRLVDLDNDGRADLCGRGAAGLICHLSQGDSFGPAIDGPALADDSGWKDYSNYSSIRFADVTGDGLLDACARADAGIRCWPFDGEAFGTAIPGPLKDESGWTREHYHRTLDFVDLDADGRADLCARASRGVVCWRSTGTAFEEALIEGPAWSDAAGFTESKYYGTVAFPGAVRPAPQDPEVPGGDVGTPTQEADGGTTSRPDSGPATTSPDAGPLAGQDSGADYPREINASESGCGCAQANESHGVDAALVLLAASFFAGSTGRTRRRRR